MSMQGAQKEGTPSRDTHILIQVLKEGPQTHLQIPLRQRTLHLLLILERLRQTLQRRRTQRHLPMIPEPRYDPAHHIPLGTLEGSRCSRQVIGNIVLFPSFHGDAEVDCAAGLKGEQNVSDVLLRKGAGIELEGRGAEGIVFPYELAVEYR